MATIQNAIDAGLDVLNAVEPIGPEHSPEVLAEQIELMKSTSPIQTGVMKRINVPGTPFEGTGEITSYELSLICAVQCLAHVDVNPLPWIGHHEPTPICYAAGSNLITAETGVNPRDTAADTSQNRGMDLTDWDHALRGRVHAVARAMARSSISRRSTSRRIFTRGGGRFVSGAAESCIGKNPLASGPTVRVRQVFASGKTIVIGCFL